MDIPVLLWTFIACVLAIAIIGNPQSEQMNAQACAKLRRWRRLFYAVEVVAAAVLIWQVSFK